MKMEVIGFLPQCAWHTLAMTLGLLAVFSIATFLFERFMKKIIPGRSMDTGVQPIPQINWTMPFIGEGLKIWWKGVPAFFYDHAVKLGEVYRMSVLGYNVHVVNSPDLIKLVLSSPHNVMQYPGTVFSLYLSPDMLTEERLVEMHGYVRKATLAIYSGESVRNNLSLINQMASEAVDSWLHLKSVTASDELHKCFFRIVTTMGWKDMTEFGDFEKLQEEMKLVNIGLLSARINLPFCNWYKALKARNSIVPCIQKCITKRIDEGHHHEDVIGSMILNGGAIKYTPDQLASIVLTVFTAATITSISLVTWIIKYLHDYPNAREFIQAENDEIQKKLLEDDTLKWFKIKSSMPLTLQVVNEVLRLSSSSNVLPRRTTKEVHFKGYTFPKDCTMWASTSHVHMDPKIYPEPMSFNPSRFQMSPLNPNNFVAFGAGPHMCPGQEMALSMTLIILNHFVTKCRWERLGHDKQNYMYKINATSKPKDGFPMIVTSRTSP